MNAAATNPPPAAEVDRWRAYLELFRLPNVFTAVSNVLMGALFVGPALIWPVVALLVAASGCLYLAGIVLNDVFDLAVDAQERPQRPLPSGRVSLSTARLLGVELLVVGVACGWGASYFTGRVGSGAVASLLAAAVVLYDAAAKQTPLGPLVMGACRTLNVLLGMTAASVSSAAALPQAAPWHMILPQAAPWPAAHLLVALGVGVYIVGVTWFARAEATVSRRGALIAALVVMLTGLGLTAAFPLASGAPPLTVQPPMAWWALWGFLAASNLWRCVRAIAQPGPQEVQQAVRRCILALVIYDAAIVLVVAGGAWATAVLALLIPTLWLGRWIYST